MNRCVYLLNSTPKYYWILPLHCLLLRRYAPNLTWPIVLATEEPTHPICKELEKTYGVQLLILPENKAGFLDSRAEALRLLRQQELYTYVFPIQEDFLLDRTPQYSMIQEAVQMMEQDSKLASVRLMPSPGPKGAPLPNQTRWAPLSIEYDTYGFSFQATLWRLDACAEWYRLLTEKLTRDWPPESTTPVQRKRIELVGNFAENADGQVFFWKFSMQHAFWHAAWVRSGDWSNAVYLCPWPYRPTAIVNGLTATWAVELAKREGVPFT
jgi:hypothetical protein